MLVICNKYNEIDIESLFRIYLESIRQKGKINFPNESEYMQKVLAEEDEISYLRSMFSEYNATLALWEVESVCEAALRLEKYEDGFLITALETAPAMRGRGYAKALVESVVTWLGNRKPVKLYAHIEKGNRASISVHSYCGFEKIKDYATFLDGSVSHKYFTYGLEIK